MMIKMKMQNLQRPSLSASLMVCGRRRPFRSVSFNYSPPTAFKSGRLAAVVSHPTHHHHVLLTTSKKSSSSSSRSPFFISCCLNDDGDEHLTTVVDGDQQNVEVVAEDAEKSEMPLVPESLKKDAADLKDDNKTADLKKTPDEENKFLALLSSLVLELTLKFLTDTVFALWGI